MRPWSRIRLSIPFAIVITLALAGSATAKATPGATTGRFFEIAEDVLEDKIEGGMLGQLFGNLNGLKHEHKYIDEPGAVAEYKPDLPNGAWADDDTDIEWVYVTEMSRSGKLLLAPARIRALWKENINHRIWCANKYARHLMELGIEPHFTGRLGINPWAEFNISGQFVSEAFGLMSPAMPRTAAKLGLHYTRVTIDGEPAQLTQLVTAMIALAFVDHDVERIVLASLAAVDPNSDVHRIVREVHEMWKQNPQDWKATRLAVKTKYQRYEGKTRDRNGYELNLAASIGALLYGRGDFAETLRLAFNFGWDADNNAATAGAIIGVIRGAKWMRGQGWVVKDVYENRIKDGLPTREKMPMDETISSYTRKLIGIAKRLIVENGGTALMVGDKKVFRIRRQSPGVAENVVSLQTRERELRATFLPKIRRWLSGSEEDKARAAYLSVSLGEAANIQRRSPAQWAAALQALKRHTGLVEEIFKAPPPLGVALIDRARAAGLEPPLAKSQVAN